MSVHTAATNALPLSLTVDHDISFMVTEVQSCRRRLVRGMS